MSDGLDDGWVLKRLERWRTRRDGDALGELLKWQRDRAYAIARRVLGHATDAEDAVQQSFIKLLSRTQGFDGVNEFKLAVYRAVMQCALDMARANRVRSRLEKAMSQVERATALMPEHAAEQAEAARLVLEELEQLPEDQRALVVLCYQEGLSVSDAAEVLAVPRETLRDRLATSLADLRKRVDKRGVAVSLFLLVGALQQGGAEAAPASLCGALDVTLPGAPCAEIPPAHATMIPRAELLSVTNTPSSLFPTKALLATAAALALAFGGWVAWSSTGASQQVATAPNSRQPVVPTTVVRSSASRIESPKPAAVQSPLPVTVPAAPQPAAAETAIERKARKDAEAKRSLERVPTAAREAAARALRGVVLTKAKEDREDGVLVYEFNGTADGKEYEIRISAEGKILEVKQDNDKDDDDGDNEFKVPAPAPKLEAPKADF